MSEKVPKFLSVAILVVACLPVIILTYPGIKELYGNTITEYFAKNTLEKNKKQCDAIDGSWIEPRYGQLIEPRCIPPYADTGAPCNYSNQCQGSCVATNNTKALEDCTRLSNTDIFGKSHTENYFCPNIKFEGRCSKFKWERNPELNGNTISNHIEYLDLHSS